MDINKEENYIVLAPGEHVVFMEKFIYYQAEINSNDRCKAAEILYTFEVHDGYEICMITRSNDYKYIIFYRNIVPVKINRAENISKINPNAIPHFGTPITNNILKREIKA